jgi:hypothetical protein
MERLVPGADTLESFKTPHIAKQVLVGSAIVIDEANRRYRRAW